MDIGENMSEDNHNHDRIESPDGTQHVTLTDNGISAIADNLYMYPAGEGFSGNTIVSGVFQVSGASSTRVPTPGDPYDQDGTSPEGVGDLHITQRPTIVSGYKPYKRDLNEYNPNSSPDYITDYEVGYTLSLDPRHETHPGIFAAQNASVVNRDLYTERNAFMATHPNHITTKKYVDDRIQFALDEVTRLANLNDELARQNQALYNERGSLQEAVRRLNEAYQALLRSQ